MKKEVWYFYMGTNGTILSPVHLEDTYYTRRCRLIADEKKLLTDGKTITYSITVPEDEVENWREIDKD
jgi:hypothetical protein